MRDKNNKNINDSEAAFALNTLLTKLLLGVLLGALGWLTYSALSGNGEIKIYLRSLNSLYSL